MSKTVSIRRSWPLAVLFLLAIFAQQQAFSHQLSHAAPDSSHRAPNGDNNNCAKCQALVQLGNGPGSLDSILTFETVVRAQALSPAIILPSAPFVAYSCRAPPGAD